MVASSGFLTRDYLSLQGFPPKKYGSLITGVTATSPPVTTTGSSNYVIVQTSLSYANGTYRNQSYPLATLVVPMNAKGFVALHPEKSLVPLKQAAASSTDSAQLSQLNQASAPTPSPAQSGTSDSNSHPATFQQQDDPNTQAASSPGSDNHGSASPAYILLGSSTYFLPQITTRPAPVVADKPVVDAGGGNFQVNGQTLSRGGATANIEGTSVYVNPQGAPVVGTQTYPPGPTAATSIIGIHTVVVNPAGVIFDGEQIETDAAPVNAGETQVPFESSSVTPGPADNGPTVNDPAGDSVLKLPSEPAVSSMMIAGASVVNYQGSLKVQGTPLAAGATLALSGTTWSLSPSSPANSINLNVGGKTYNLPQMTLPPITTIAGHEVQALGPSAIAIDGQTLTQGAPSLILSSSVPVIFGSSNLVIGTSTISIQPQNEAPLPSILNLAGGQSLTQAFNNPNAYLISGTTLLPGSPAAIISGTSYSLALSGALIVGTSTIPFATAGSNAATGILTAGSEVFTPLGSTAVAVNGATLSLNGPGTTDHGTVLSLGPGGLVVGSSTYAFATPAAAPPPPPSAAATTQQFPITTVLSAAGQTFTANPSGFNIAGTTLSPGSPGITIAGTRISLGASGILDIGSSTVNLSPTALTVAGQTFTPKPTAFSIAGTTLTAGGPGITISGTLISLGTSGLLDIGGSTIKLSSPTAYTIAGQTFTPNPTAFSVDGTTITAGGPGATISGTPIRLQPGGELVIGSSTIPLSVYTIAGQTFTPNPTAFSIDGTTITAGGPGLNINGTSILLEPGAKLVIGNSTFSLPASNIASATSTPNFTTSSIAASSSTIAPGGGSTSAIGGGGGGATRTGSKVHGGAVGMRCKRFWWEGVGFVGVWMMMMKALL